MTTTTTIDPLIQPLLTSLTQASTLCAAIKTSRHCGSTHTQLDLLETSLAAGPSFLATATTGLEHAPIDEAAQKALTTCNTQLALICGRLQAIARPSNPSSHTTSPPPTNPPAHAEHKHHAHANPQHRSHSSSSSDEKHREKEPQEEEEHHRHRKRRSSTTSLLFAAFEPLRHHQHKDREVEDPHFKDIRGMWEDVRDAVTQTLTRVKEGHAEEEVTAKKTDGE